MTQLRKSNLSLEQVNKLTDHAQGSIVVDEYYNKPDHPLGIDDFINQNSSGGGGQLMNTSYELTASVGEWSLNNSLSEVASDAPSMQDSREEALEEMK
ncbi:MAG: hypothetical protein EZS28_009196 [Streblomastix strix]|uniref:Uncharacterized protein n=1 Tax=Streblomastix strix TaxID=222440 RepID=A0A5J4WJT0_9EUKA|nr:MAG: hypothetical protein EZS28_009196 [Streblomastix strix]